MRGSASGLRTSFDRVKAGALFLLLLVVMPCGLGADAKRSVARLDGIFERPCLRKGSVGVLVVEADEGRLLYARQPDQPLAPASNQKILTALAALSSFGPAYQFVTRVYADVAPVEGVIGHLVVAGGGDPALTSEDWWRIAADLRRLGVRRVEGDLIVDDRLFDRQHWHPSWRPLASRAYHSPVGALTANYGSIAVAIEAGRRAGQPVRAVLDPPVPWLRLSVGARTVAPGARSSLQVGRRSAEGADWIDVNGSVPAGSGPEVLYRSVADPARYAGEVLRMQLEANGIEVGGEVRHGAVPPGARELIAFRGKPLAQIVRLLMKYSNNAIAEALVKMMGAQAVGGQGTWENGILALRERVTALGLDLGGATLVDGSGLSRANRVSPRVLVAALLHARQSFDLGPELVSSLPIAGLDGTLQRRGGGTMGAVRAKTGLLNRITGLSGYARASGGSDLVFSVLLNEYTCSDVEAMSVLDAFAAALAREL